MLMQSAEWLDSMNRLVFVIKSSACNNINDYVNFSIVICCLQGLSAFMVT